jgi:hypothetical protein
VIGLLGWRKRRRESGRTVQELDFHCSEAKRSLARLKPWTEECFDVRPSADPRRKRCYDSGGRRRDGQQ